MTRSEPTFRIARAALDAVRAHAAAEAPREACGLLVGPDNVATEAWPLPNEAAEPHCEFLMAGGLCAAQRRLRAEGLRLLAHYHSHPAGLPVPSAADRARNPDPDRPHVVVGLAPAPEIRAWRGPRLAAPLPLAAE